jgi:shikimate dehydrogenase
MSFRFALIGQPVAHSRSPSIHQQFAAQCGDDIAFELIECVPEQVAETVATFFSAGGHGMNVTLPHKNAVLSCCAAVSADARLAKAVNTLVPKADGLHGENTDGAGLMRDLKRLGIAIAGQRIAVIGAGGAARGIIKPLLDEAPAELVWSHRNPLKLEGLEADFQAYGQVICRANMALKGDSFDLLIHASSAGHKGVAPFLPDHLIAAGGTAYDLSYGAAAQPFLDWARSQGAAATHDGLGMLVEQAALAYEHWTGRLPETTAVHAALRAAT